MKLKNKNDDNVYKSEKLLDYSPLLASGKEYSSPDEGLEKQDTHNGIS
jgi:hypothetical protein